MISSNQLKFISLVIFLLSSFTFSASVRDVAQNKRFQITPDDLKSAEVISQIYNELFTMKLTPELMNQVVNIAQKSLFQEEKPWLESLYKIYQTKNFSDLTKNVCPQIKLKDNALNSQTIIFCRKVALNQLKSKMNAQKLGLSEINWVKNNLKYFVNSTNDLDFNDVLKNAKQHQKVSYNELKAISARYLKSKKISPQKHLASLIGWEYRVIKKYPKPDPEKKEPKKTTTVKLPPAPKNLTRLVRYHFSLPDKTNDRVKVEKEIDSLIKRVQGEKSKFNKSDFASKLIYLAQFYTRREYYQKARELFELSLSLDKEGVRDEAYFGILWTYLYQSQWAKALQYANLVDLSGDWNKETSQLMFWTGYTLLKNKKVPQAYKMFSLTIRNHPLSYYSILASKYLKNHEDPEKQDIASFTPNAYQFFEFFFDSKKIDTDLENIVRRVKLWSLSHNDPFVYKELKKLKDINPTAYGSNDESFSVFTAKVLSDAGYHLEAFKAIYNPLNKGELSFHQELLPILYPLNHYQELSKIGENKTISAMVVLSLIRQESAFNSRARSTAGARGLMQIMPGTAKTIKPIKEANDLYDPELNLDIGTDYFKKLYSQYQGNLVYTLAAYNAGPLRVDEWRQTSFHREEMIFNIENIPYRETRNYVKLIYRNLFFYKLLNLPDSQDSSDPNQVFDVAWNYTK